MPVATLKAMSSANQVLAHLGAPPITPEHPFVGVKELETRGYPEPIRTAILGHASYRGHTLQPTALVNETFLRLAKQDRGLWKNRNHFYGAAAHAMRRVLVDHARARVAAKRGSGQPIQVLDDSLWGNCRSVQLLFLDDALQRLATVDQERSRIVELRFFRGLTVAETAEVLSVSVSTVERGWRLARAWLARELEDH